MAKHDLAVWKVSRSVFREAEMNYVIACFCVILSKNKRYPNLYLPLLTLLKILVG